MPQRDGGGELDRASPPHATGSAHCIPSSGPVGEGPLAFDSGPQAAPGPQGLKSSLPRWGEVGAMGGFLDIKQALAKLADELRANECETDNEVPFGDTWAETRREKRPREARWGNFFFFLDPKRAGKTNPPVYARCQGQAGAPWQRAGHTRVARAHAGKERAELQRPVQSWTCGWHPPTYSPPHPPATPPEGCGVQLPPGG